MYRTPRCATRAALVRTVMISTLTISVALPNSTSAQPCTDCADTFSATTAEHWTIFSINALIGGVTAGLSRLVRGDPVKQALSDGFLRGAMGGGLAYAGKRVAASHRDGAGWIGREIAAFGASTTVNAANGIGTFDRLIFPLGPLPARIVVTRHKSRFSVQPVFDLLSSAAVIYGLAASNYSLDWGASLSGGVAVFREHDPLLDANGVLDVERASGDDWPNQQDGYRAGATSVGGAAFVSYLAPEENVLAHERVHTIQFDFFTATLSDPADTWLMVRVPAVDRWLKLNLVPLAFGAINHTLEPLANHDSFPWEREAILLSGRR